MVSYCDQCSQDLRNMSIEGQLVDTVGSRAETPETWLSALELSPNVSGMKNRCFENQAATLSHGLSGWPNTKKILRSSSSYPNNEKL